MLRCCKQGVDLKKMWGANKWNIVKYFVYVVLKELNSCSSHVPAAKKFLSSSIPRETDIIVIFATGQSFTSHPTNIYYMYLLFLMYLIYHNHDHQWPLFCVNHAECMSRPGIESGASGLQVRSATDKASRALRYFPG